MSTTTYRTYGPAALSIFVSYAWACRKDDVRSLADHLRHKCDMNVWIDRDEIRGSTQEKMTEGIDGADVVLICFSEAYKNSDNCRKEATYAENRKKIRLFLRLEKKAQLDGWLGFQAADLLWSDFSNANDTIESVGNRLADELLALYDDAYRWREDNNNKSFRAFGMNRNLFSEAISWPVEIEQKMLKAIQNCSRTATNEGKRLLVKGDEGVGKTHFICKLLLDKTNESFFAKECRVGVVFYLDCFNWRNENDMNDMKAQANFQTAIVDLVSKATKRNKQSADFQAQIDFLKSKHATPPLFVFDDVRNFALLSLTRSICDKLPCIVITRSSDVAIMEASGKLWLSTTDIVEYVSPMADDQIMKIMKNLKNDNNVGDDVLREKLNDLRGLPSLAVDYVNGVSGRNSYPTAVSSQSLMKVDSKNVANSFAKRKLMANDSEATDTTTEANRRQEESLAKVKFVNVTAFDSYFDRPEEENAVKKGIRSVAGRSKADNGFSFVVCGCGGIGKSTLVSHVLRDPKNNTFYQRECNIQIVIWLNCYKWEQGFVDSRSAKLFLDALLELGKEEDEDFKGNSIRKMLEHFADRGQRILFILDDVFHFSILRSLKEATNDQAICVAITRNPACLHGPSGSFNPFLEMNRNDNRPSSSNPFPVGYLTDEQVDNLLGHLKGPLGGQRFRNLVKISCGLPLFVNMIRGRFVNCSDSQYEREYKSFLKEASTLKFGSTNVDTLGRGEETAKHIFKTTLLKLGSETYHCYFAFLLFDPMEKVPLNWLKLLWLFEDDYEFDNVCDQLLRLSLVRQGKDFRRRDCYLVHQILWEAAHDMAVKELVKSNQLSMLRKGIILAFEDRHRNEEMQREPSAAIVSFLQRFADQDGEPLRRILSHIENAAFKCNNELSITATEIAPSPNVLVSTVRTGHFYLSKFLIEKGNDVNAKDGDKTVLILASSKGHIEIAKLLIDKGADVNANDDSGGTALMTACFYGHTEMAKLLIDNGADVNEKGIVDGRTALMWASSKGHTDIPKLLIGKGADVNAKDNGSKTALTWASLNGRTEVSKLLIDRGADVAAQGGLALIWAAFYGYTEMAELLIDKGVDVNAKDDGGKTALMKASSNGLAAMAKLLIEKGADVNAKGKDGKTALILASLCGSTETAVLLIEKGADVNAKDNRGGTALMTASFRRHIEMAKLLLGKGADVNAIGNDRGTALMLAPSEGDTELAKLLIDHGADLEAQGGMALIWAAFYGYTEVVELLIDKGVDANAKDDDDRTALTKASSNGHAETAKLLIEKGANVNAKGKDGSTALMLASSEGHTDIAKLLIDMGASS